MNRYIKRIGLFYLTLIKFNNTHQNILACDNFRKRGESLENFRGKAEICIFCQRKDHGFVLIYFSFPWGDQIEPIVLIKAEVKIFSAFLSDRQNLEGNSLLPLFSCKLANQNFEITILFNIF